MLDQEVDYGRFYLGVTDLDEWLDRRRNVDAKWAIRLLGLSAAEMDKFQDRMAGIHRRLNDVLARRESVQ